MSYETIIPDSQTGRYQGAMRSQINRYGGSSRPMAGLGDATYNVRTYEAVTPAPSVALATEVAEAFYDVKLSLMGYWDDNEANPVVPYKGELYVLIRTKGVSAMAGGSGGGFSTRVSFKRDGEYLLATLHYTVFKIRPKQNKGTDPNPNSPSNGDPNQPCPPVPENCTTKIIQKMLYVSAKPQPNAIEIPVAFEKMICEGESQQAPEIDCEDLLKALQSAVGDGVEAIGRATGNPSSRIGGATENPSSRYIPSNRSYGPNQPLQPLTGLGDATYNVNTYEAVTPPPSVALAADVAQAFEGGLNVRGYWDDKKGAGVVLYNGELYVAIPNMSMAGSSTGSGKSSGTPVTFVRAGATRSYIVFKIRPKQNRSTDQNSPSNDDWCKNCTKTLVKATAYITEIAVTGSVPFPVKVKVLVCETNSAPKIDCAEVIAAIQKGYTDRQSGAVNGLAGFMGLAEAYSTGTITLPGTVPGGNKQFDYGNKPIDSGTYGGPSSTSSSSVPMWLWLALAAGGTVAFMSMTDSKK